MPGKKRGTRRRSAFLVRTLEDDAWSVTESLKIHGRPSLHYLTVTAINKTLASRALAHPSLSDASLLIPKTNSSQLSIEGFDTGKRWLGDYVWKLQVNFGKFMCNAVRSV
ncbi:hypothetical protein NPIL_306571 [Nephila pilipes]|uniref:Uncharacterized protein n=1 Tax=Nephila pilipes TaxID=299642 RepID=A0A8X6PTX2_NEPPI|nr:hypothetical protein NPIL_306571 [Nephila pilipes]